MARKVSKSVPALKAVTRKISKRVRKVTAGKGKKAVELICGDFLRSRS
jgi:hypothetical protein